MGRAVAWLWLDGSDRRYRVTRRLLAGVIAIRLAAGSFGDLADQDPSQLRPPGFLSWMSAFPSEAWLVSLQVLGVALAVLAASGWGQVRAVGDRLRIVAASVAFPAAYLVYLYLEGVKTSGGKILHNDVLLLLVALPFVFVPENRRERREHELVVPGPRRNVGWPFNLSLLILVSSYFLAGVAKLMHSGPEWIFSDNVRYVMYWAAQSDRPPDQLRWLAEIPGNSSVIAQIVAATTIVFEVGAPAVLVWKRLRPYLAFAAVGLHLGTWAAIGIDYWGWALTALVVLVDWGQTEPRRHVAGSSLVDGDDASRREVVAEVAPGAEGLLVYDGDCGFCTQSARWVERRAAGQAVIESNYTAPLDRLGLTLDQATEQVWWIAADGTAHAGHRAVAMTLWVLGGPAVLAARFLLLPGVGFVAGPGYRLVARNRHRLPGATDACRLDL